MRKTGNERLTHEGKDIGLCLRDFWSWGYSDLLDNTLRGSYSEFIVAAALGIDLSAGRVNWEPWDLTLHGEKLDVRVEVKSCSYLQAWTQERPSDIKFSIRPAMAWSAENGWCGEQRRPSDVYVFCVFAERDGATADPLRLDGWEFYVVPTKKLDECCAGQKTIGLRSLLRLDPMKTDFAGLKAAVLRSV